MHSLISRRTIVGGGLALGGLAMAPRAIAQDDPAGALITKPIPSTGERLPVIGIGTNNFGVDDPAEVAARKEVLRDLPLLGGKLVDTARGYGSSEEVIGRLVAELGNRDKLFLATKTPMAPLGGAVTPAVLDDSFRRLRTDRIDLFQVHNLNGVDALMPLLLDYKQAKKIRYIGITTSRSDQHEEMMAAMRKHRLDFIQIDYSIANRAAADKVLPLAQARGIAVLNNVPFDGRRGNLAGRLASTPLPPLAKEHGLTSWAQVLLRYNVSHPAITAAIPGTTKISHLRDNQRAGRGTLFDAKTRTALEAYWEKQGIA